MTQRGHKGRSPYVSEAAKRLESQRQRWWDVNRRVTRKLKDRMAKGCARVFKTLPSR